MLLKSIQLSKKIRCAMENARDVAVLAGDVGEANDLHINTTGLLPIPLGVRNLFLN
jgi:hypothetical protein